MGLGGEAGRRGVAKATARSSNDLHTRCTPPRIPSGLFKQDTRAGDAPDRRRGRSATPGVGAGVRERGGGRSGGGGGSAPARRCGRVRRCEVGCGVPRRVRRCEVGCGVRRRVRRCEVGCGGASLGAAFPVVRSARPKEGARWRPKPSTIGRSGRWWREVVAMSHKGATLRATSRIMEGWCRIATITLQYRKSWQIVETSGRGHRRREERRRAGIRGALRNEPCRLRPP